MGYGGLPTRCLHCGKPLKPKRERKGRPGLYCNQEHKRAHYRLLAHDPLASRRKTRRRDDDENYIRIGNPIILPGPHVLTIERVMKNRSYAVGISPAQVQSLGLKPGDLVRVIITPIEQE